MATSKRPVKRPKKTVSSKKPAKKPVAARRRLSIPSPRQISRALGKPFVTFYRYLRRKREDAPHKSFVRTRKRDKIKTPHIEGYIAFPWYVLRVLWNRKWAYIRLVVLFVVLVIVAIGAMQTANIGTANSLLDSVNKEGGGNIIGPVMRAASTVMSGLNGALNGNLSDVQYIYLSALLILGLLTVVWMLRQQLAGNKVNVRDGLYNAATPIAAQYALVGIALLQLVPFALVSLVYMSALSVGLLDGGIESAMFSIALFLVAVITLYFMTTTLFAMFIATIPGTYPLKAYRAARQLVTGQRLRLLMRLLWMLVIVVVAMFLILMPIIIIINSFSLGSSLLIPLAFQIVLTACILYGTAYGYLLYRRMIDDPISER